MTRTKILVGSLLGAIAIHLACSGVMGGTDAGDAQAQSMDAGSAAIEGACSAVAAPLGMQYIADISVPGLDPRAEVHAIVCGFVCTSTGCSINGAGFGVAGAECRSAPAVFTSRGRVQVLCGTEPDHAQTARVWAR